MDKVLDEYYGLLPSILFLCEDDMHSMHFVLSLKHQDQNSCENSVKMLLHCGAEVSFDINDVTDYSAVLADHNDPIPNYKGPVFKFNYVQSCFQELSCLDISQFRQERTSHVADGVRCMDVVYYRIMTWSSVIAEIRPSQVEVAAEQGNEETPVGMSSPLAMDMDDDTSGLDEDSEKEECNVVNPPPSNSANVWKFVGLSSDESYEEDSAAEETAPNQKCTARNKKRFDLNDGLSSDESVQKTPATAKTRPHRKCTQLQVKSSSEHNQFKSTQSTSSTNKHTRAPYSHEDRCTILKYILANNAHDRVKGREFWSIMERRKVIQVLPFRTWQSMKEHYLKKIVVNLDVYSFLTRNDKMRLKNTGL